LSAGLVALDGRGGGLGGLDFERHHHVVLAKAEQVAVRQAMRGVAAEGPLVVVDVDAVGAQVFQVIVALAEADATVMSGHVTQRIGQHPVIVGGTADGAASDSEDDVAAVP
jgi:hypothetical protein